MDVRRDSVLKDFVRFLVKLRPALKAESMKDRLNIAHLVKMATSKSRQHNRVTDHMSISHKELEQRFGRNEWRPLNDRLSIFAVDNEFHTGSTKAYKLKPDLVEPVHDWLASWLRLRKFNRALLTLDGKQLHKTPAAVASKDANNQTAKTQNRRGVERHVPVHLDKLKIFAKQLEANKTQADMFSRGEVADYRYRIEALGEIMRAAREIGGEYFAIQHYKESASGRLYGQGHNLATAPTSIKQVALHGLWEYDFSNCHYSIFSQLAAKHGLVLPAVAHYLAHKSEVRGDIARTIKISEDQAKKCLISLIYGSTFSHRSKDAIPDEIGLPAALKLYKHPLFKALKDDVTRAMNVIVDQWPRSRKIHLKNDFGKFIEQPEQGGNSKAQVLAHLCQGIEAKMLAAVRKLHDREIVLLQHDGFASRVQLDVGRMEQAILKDTGYQIKIDQEQISISLDLGIKEKMKPNRKTAI